MIRLWLAGMLRRNPARLLAGAVGIAIAVALVAGLGSFLVSSQATMTKRAAAQVAVDWQVQVASGADPRSVLSAVRATPGTAIALPVGFAESPGLQSSVAGTSQQTGAAKVLGLPAGYAAAFPASMRLLTGTTNGALVAQQTAANLHVAPGDLVSIARAGSTTYQVRIAGVVELPQADSLFQRIGAPKQSQPLAPPDNVVLLPDSTFRAAYAALAVSRPDQVSTQIHARRDHRTLPSDPASAFVDVTGQANNLAVRTSGAAIVGNNLGASLDAARGDAAYAAILFLFLGLPGALLAIALTAAVTQAGAERRRTEQALLRARGTTPGQLVRLVLAEACLIGVLGAVLGIAVAASTGGAGSWGWDLGSALAGLATAVLVIARPAIRDLRAEIASGGLRHAQQTSPAWMRYGVDLVLIAAGLGVFWAAGRTKYALVLAPEGVPTISVSYWAFLAPALAWIGGGLLCWRIASNLLRARKAVGWVARPALGPIAPAIASMLMRQRRSIARSTVLIGLALAFAVSVATFNATYKQQAEVDAQLSSGADVTVTSSPGAGMSPAQATQLATVSGVRAVEPLIHRFAYVGSDLQDIFGIRPTTLHQATTLQDAYFQRATAAESMARLAGRHDGLLVSAETVNDFQLRPGDLVRLRLQDARTHQYRAIDFHYVGIVNEFPTAPKDSFLVANASYLAEQTGSPAIGSFLLSTGGHDQTGVAAAVRKVVGTSGLVGTITDVRGLVGSSLTSVDLAHLTRLELAFALAIAAAAGGLVIGLGLSDRKRGVAIATSLGATRRQIRGIGLAEPIFVLVVGTVSGLLGGWGLSQLLVKVLTGVFDPPPAHLAVPWGYLSASVLVTVAAVAVAGGTVVERIRHRARDVLRGI